MTEIYKQLKEFGKVKLNESMAKHTTFKIGGPVDFFITVDDANKHGELLKYLQGQGLDYYILGGGSNLLWQDERYEGVVIKIIGGKIEVDSNVMIADVGVSWAVLVNTATQNDLSGLEWGVGIPGMVGGAVRGNAGAMGSDVSKVLDKVLVWKDGEVVEIPNQELDFSYRSSIIKKQKDIVVLKAFFKLQKGNKAEILKQMQEYLKKRTSGRFPTAPSPGSFFKNLEIEKWQGKLEDLPDIFVERKKIPVGWLIENCGLKGYTVGGAKISDEHGNFIINIGNASQADVLSIIEKVKEKVYNKFGIELEEEVQIINL
jgi:UDP-N-acetylmuramate dehydrogenase